MSWTPTRYGLPSPGPHDEVEPLRETVAPGTWMEWHVPRVTLQPIKESRRTAMLTFSDLRGS